MPETRTAKLFKNGSSQAVRLPAEFRFAISQDAVLVTNNFRHYQRIKAPLMLENWA